MQIQKMLKANITTKSANLLTEIKLLTKTRGYLNSFKDLCKRGCNKARTVEREKFNRTQKKLP